MDAEIQAGTVAAGKPSRMAAYVQIGVGALLVTGAEVLLKKGASVEATGLLGIAALGSWWTWGGIGLHIAELMNWLMVLRRMPLAVAYSLLSVVHVLVPVAAWGFLGEPIPARRWAGIVLVLLGIGVIARAYARAEEAL